MELNSVATGIELIGTTVKVLTIDNNIVDVERDGKRSVGLNINEPQFQRADERLFAQILIDFDVQIIQSEEQECKIQLTIEGAFLSKENADEEVFKELVIVNGAAALIGIARGKIEAISANVFNNGKIVIPFINVVDYYKKLGE